MRDFENVDSDMGTDVYVTFDSLRTGEGSKSKILSAAANANLKAQK